MTDVTPSQATDRPAPASSGLLDDRAYLTRWLSRGLAPFQPPLDTARDYTARKFRKDVVAGLTISVVEVPQAMAYALLAGVPPQYGIYTSVIQCVTGALFSSSQHMATGPTNTQSLLIASAVTRLANPTADPATYLRLVFALALIKGIIQLCFAAARMGEIVRYVSRSVIVGLTAGAGVLIIANQAGRLVGVSTAQAPHRLAGVAGEVEKLWHALATDGFSGKALAVAAISLAAMLGVRAISRLLPGALVGVLAGGVLVVVTGWTARDLPLVGALPRSLPSFAAPQVSVGEAQSLFGGALALALLGMLESVAIAKGIAAQTGARISANQEFFAQGLANAVSSFFQCVPGSGSFTRSALDKAAGAATRFAAVYNAVFVALIFLLAGRWAQYIPLASLGAMLVVIGWGLIDWRYVPRMWRASRADAVVCGMTFVAAMILPLEYAIFLGVFLNLALYLRTASRLHLSEMIQPTVGPFLERPIHDKHTGERQVVFLQLEGDLFFGIADELQDRLTAVAGSGVRVVILRLKRTHSIDATVLGVLERFVAGMRRREGYVLVCGVKPELMSVLRHYGLIGQLGRENVFETGGGIFNSAKQALQRARVLVGRSIDTFGIPTDEPEEPNYMI